MFGSWVQLRSSRYGLRGVRIGEASHPGPPRTLRRLRSATTGHTQIEVSQVDGAGSTQWESGAEEEFPPRLRRRTRLHEEEIDPTRFVQSGSTLLDVVDMTVADSDPDSEINNRMADLVEPGRRRTTMEVHDVALPSLLDDLEHDLRPNCRR